ncbi:ATP-binding protein [Candidatus Sumerlaeota bacterium]|nr:ATP-binding protein [Candidatus Sumerlaeota bacterium]
MKELVVISGKGGTGKTSVVASFAALSRKSVLADCDVDAADLHLILDPQTIQREKFEGGKKARIRTGHCTACGKCEELCRFDAIFYDGPGNGFVNKTFRIDPIACEGCGVCAWFCAEDAIEFAPAINGEWMISETRYGPMVHAKLGIAAENSGKLVSLVRQEARNTAEQRKIDLIMVDGSPGIGCPVIASVSGANLALIITEPTQSGRHDLLRAAELTRHFEIPTLVCVNKWDINSEIASEIEQEAQRRGIAIAGRIRYDRKVTEAQISRKAVVEFQEDGSAEDIKELWQSVMSYLKIRDQDTPSSKEKEK